MNVQDLAKRYLAEAPVMHLATTKDDKPWTVPVFFVIDDELNLYWLSWPERRHSQLIAANPQVAVSVAIKVGVPVVGIEAEGRAAEVTDSATVEAMMPRYVAKYDAGHQFAKRFRRGVHHHRLYRLAVERMVLFDEVNFSESQTLLPKAQ